MAAATGNKKYPEVMLCKVFRTDETNAVCTTYDPACNMATPYGNYCEHPCVYQLGEFIMPGEATFPRPDQEPQ